MSAHDLLIAAAAFAASLLTLMTGFGLGTILTPVTALFYDVKLAILIVAVVHILNNGLKLWLFRSHVDVAIFRRFGLLSVAGAVAGALLQSVLASSAVTMVLGAVLVLLGAGEFLPSLVNFRFPQKLDMLGGFSSGLLGGLVGNQGAIRSAYLLNYDIPKESFIATASVIALVIDATRIPLYLSAHGEYLSQLSWNVLPVVALAFLGTITGKRILSSLSGNVFKKAVAASVVAIGVLFLTGVL